MRCFTVLRHVFIVLNDWSDPPRFGGRPTGVALYNCGAIAGQVACA